MRRETVLIAEDEELVRKLLGLSLESCYDLVLARDGQEAINLCRARSEPIALALIDIVMPGMNGFELLSRLRELFPKARVIFTSGYPHEEAFALAGLSLNAGRFLQKPFTVHQVREIVRAELALAGEAVRTAEVV